MRLVYTLLEDEYSQHPESIVHGTWEEALRFLREDRSYLFQEGGAEDGAWPPNFPDTVEKLVAWNGYPEDLGGVRLEVWERPFTDYVPELWSAFCNQWLVLALVCSPLGDHLCPSQRGGR